MEENNQVETNEIKEEKTNVCFKNHCWKMCLGMVLAAFMGGFLATYFVADQMMEKCHKRYMMPAYNFDQKMFNAFDGDLQRDMKHFNKMMKKQAKDMDNFRNPFAQAPIFMPEPVKIKSDFDDGNFNVEVDLKPFQDDENKINYNVAGKKLTVFGESKVQNGKSEEDISFSHDFILPENADTMSIKKEKDGNKVVISVPIK